MGPLTEIVAKERAAAPVPEFTLPRLQVRYFFTVSCDLTSTSPSPIKIPGGTRVQLTYKSTPDSVLTEAGLFKASWNLDPDPKLGDVTPEERASINTILEKP